jgi:hypothetical protein
MLAYVAPMGPLRRAPPSFTVERAGVLFAGDFEVGGYVVANYDPSPDGRLLMIERAEDAEPAPFLLVVVDNWFAELRQKVR